MKTAWFAAAVLAAGLAPALAEDAPPKTETAEPKQESQQPVENKGARKQVDRLSAEFGVTEAEVRDLRAKGLGWGEVRHALGIARKAEVPVGRRDLAHPSLTLEEARRTAVIASLGLYHRFGN